MIRIERSRLKRVSAWSLALAALLLAGAASTRDDEISSGGEPGMTETPLRDSSIAGGGADRSLFDDLPQTISLKSDEVRALPERKDAMRTIQGVALFGLVSLAPVGLLMLTAFVRINIVFLLLRQALGSPQIPGNQVLAVLAILLTALVMRPVGEEVYKQAILPYAAGGVDALEALRAASRPVKAFMVDQIVRTRHQDYLWSLHRQAYPKASLSEHSLDEGGFPLRVVAPAFLLSELSTALVMGFYLYLPFLVIDLVVASVLASMGLYMLPPTLVAMPVKLIVFVLADGWMLVASMLLSSFAGGGL